MTKIPKGTITTLEGRYQALIKNLLTIDGKNISVPVDVKVAGLVGDKIRIRYDDRGFLIDSELIEAGTEEEVKAELKQWQDASVRDIYNHGEVHARTGSASTKSETKEQIEIKKFMPDQIFIQRLITLRACYKECCETVRALVLLPDSSLDEEEYNRLMDIAIERTKKDAQALMEAAGEK